jgi:hypothetical protein
VGLIAGARFLRLAQTGVPVTSPPQLAVINCYEFFGIYLREKTSEQTLNPMTAVMNAIQLELLAIARVALHPRTNVVVFSTYGRDIRSCLLRERFHFPGITIANYR